MAARRLSAALLALAALSLAACAAPQSAALIEAPGALPLRAEAPGVPFFAQEDNYCGPASLAMLLAWSGGPADPAELAERVYTPGREGTFQADLLTAARRAGRLAVPLASLRGVLSELDAGHPVLVLQNLALDWYPQWHYAVAVAYDLERREITLRSGRDPAHTIPIETFERTWRRGDHWALVVLKPGALPASAGMSAVERAAAGLERVGRTAEAARAYAAILERWPTSYAAPLGLGNVRYGAGDFAAAEAAFRKAIAAQPDRAEAWNNLAYALAARGQREAALAAARTAIELSPGNDAPYRETLEELSGA